MTAFILYMQIWTFLALFFSGATVTKTIIDNKKVEAAAKENAARASKTIFLSDFNRKEVFSLDGDFSDQQIVEHDGKTYLVYFDKAENDTIYMCIKAVFDVNAN